MKTELAIQVKLYYFSHFRGIAHQNWEVRGLVCRSDTVFINELNACINIGLNNASASKPISEHILTQKNI